MLDVVVLLFEMEWVEPPKDTVANDFLKMTLAHSLTLSSALRKLTPPRGHTFFPGTFLGASGGLVRLVSGVASERGLWSPHRNVPHPSSAQLWTMVQSYR